MILAVTVNCLITVPFLHVHVSVELEQQFSNIFAGACYISNLQF